MTTLSVSKEQSRTTVETSRLDDGLYKTLEEYFSIQAGVFEVVDSGVNLVMQWRLYYRL